MFFGISLAGVDFFLYLCARFVRAREQTHVKRTRYVHISACNMHETQAIKVAKTQLFEKRKMKESILIRNFGPISEVVIEDIKPLTIFIGESGSGKSTVVKVIALFRWKVSN